MPSSRRHGLNRQRTRKLSLSCSRLARQIREIDMARTGPGRRSIFGDKDDGVRVQGMLTRKGGQSFEWKRQELAALYKRIVQREPGTVSDGDTIEFIARGEQETRRHLEKLRDSLK